MVYIPPPCSVDIGNGPNTIKLKHIAVFHPPASDRLYGEDHDFNLDEVLKEISYFRGSAYYIKEFCFDGHVKCPKKGFTKLARKVRGGSIASLGGREVTSSRYLSPTEDL